MKILRMTACFGALNHETLTLEEGLNVLYAPNEGGKSTWCAFIRAMLYGIDSSQREKNGVKPDKLRFAPWSGEPMSGEMEIEYEGERITLSRRTLSPGAPMRAFSAVYTGTAQPVEGLRGSDAGEVLTGMSRAVFDSSVFVRQTGLGVENSAELERRIAAIVSTGEENRSYSEADAALRGWLRKRRYRQSGALPALEAKLAGLEERLSELDGAVRERNAREERLQSARERARGLSRELREAEEKRRERQRQRFEESGAALARAEKESTAARERALLLRSELDGSVFAGKTAEEAARSAAEDAGLLRQLEQRRFGLWLPLLPGLLGVAALALGAVWGRLWCCVLGGVLLAAAMVLSGLRNGRGKEYARFAEAMSRRYGSREAADIEEKAREYAQSCGACQEAEQRAAAAAQHAETCAAARRAAETALLTSAPAAPELQGRLDALEEEIREQERQLAVLKGRFSALGDPMVLETERAALQARRQELQEQYEALSLAVQTLEEANGEMQRRFSPALSQSATRFMASLTSGRYDRLLFDKDLSARARPSGGVTDHDTGFLSAGTLDQLYLALRLAICQLALPEDKSCPLILDDALVNFDEERMAAAMALLRELSRERQVLLFTCHQRERRWLSGADAEE